METQRSTGVWLLAGITVLGLGLRLYRLGALGLAGNEDYLAIAVRAVLESGAPEFPSGVLYPRALPLTYLTAGLASLLGTGEAILRLPSVLFSTASILGVYLLTRRLVSAPTALLAALLMAISDWEIQVGRTARMYSMLSAGCVFSVLLLDRALVRPSWRRGAAAAAVGVLTAWVHQLAIGLGIMFAALPLHFGLDRRRLKILGAALLALAVSSVSYFLVNRLQYEQWDVVVESARGTTWEEAPDVRPDFLEDFQERYLGPWRHLANSQRGVFLALSALGAGLAIGAAAAAWRRPRELPFLSLLILMSAALYLQQLALAALVLALYVALGRQLQPDRWRSRALWLSALYLVAGTGWALFSAVTSLTRTAPGAGAAETIKQIVKPLVAYPPSFLKIYVEQYPVMSALALCAGIVALARYLDRGRVDRLGLLSLLFAAPILLLGFHPQSMGRTVERYVYFLNPFFLMLVAAGAGWIAGRLRARLAHRPRLGTTAVAAFFAVFFLTTGFGNLGAALGYVTAGYGFNESFRDRTTFEPYFHPDLAGSARFVEAERRDADVVIAMDILGHYAYSGHADYQLTLFGKPDAEGWLAARSIAGAAELTDTLDRHAGQRVWIALSATHLLWFEDDPRLAQILEVVAARGGPPRYRGRDGLSAVYLVAAGG